MRSKPSRSPDSRENRESTLLASYTAQARGYAEALTIAQDLPADFGQGGDHNERLERVLALLDKVAQIETDARETKRLWLACGDEPSRELTAVLDRVSALITQLSEHIGQAERAALAQKSRLTPQLDDAIRGRAMQQAYRRVES